MSSKHHPSSRIRFAEWVTLLVSILILLAITVAIVIEIARGDSPFLQVEAKLLLNEAEQVNGKHVVPLEVVNLGRRTMAELRVDVIHEGAKPGSGEDSRRVEFTYLSPGARQKAYLYFEQDPETLRGLIAKAAFYRVD